MPLLNNEAQNALLLSTLAGLSTGIGGCIAVSNRSEMLQMIIEFDDGPAKYLACRSSKSQTKDCWQLYWALLLG